MSADPVDMEAIERVIHGAQLGGLDDEDRHALVFNLAPAMRAEIVALRERVAELVARLPDTPASDTHPPRPKRNTPRRYRIEPSCDFETDGCTVAPVEHPAGEWVRFSDLSELEGEALRQANIRAFDAENALEELQDELQRLRSTSVEDDSIVTRGEVVALARSLYLGDDCDETRRAGWNEGLFALERAIQSKPQPTTVEEVE